MPFDPAKPASNSDLNSAEMRSQLTSLHDLIPQSAAVDATTTLPPGSPATATATLSGSTLQFTFGLPEGVPGEITGAQLSDSIATATAAAIAAAQADSSANSNGVGLLSITPSSTEIEDIVNKLNELISALRR